jgi:hypothetical protein
MQSEKIYVFKTRIRFVYKRLLPKRIKDWRMKLHFLYDMRVITDPKVLKELEENIEEKKKLIELQNFESAASFREKEWDIVFTAVDLENCRPWFKASGLFNGRVRFYKVLVH